MNNTMFLRTFVDNANGIRKKRRKKSYAGLFSIDLIGSPTNLVIILKVRTYSGTFILLYINKWNCEGFGH